MGRPIPVEHGSAGRTGFTGPTRLVRLFRRDLFPSHGADTWDNLLPTVVHVLERNFVVREREAGVDQAKARSVFNPGKGERDDSVQP